MEDAAHCSHKPSSLPLLSNTENGKHCVGFLIFSFFCDMPRGVALGCNCLIVKKEKKKKKEKKLHHNCKVNSQVSCYVNHVLGS